MNLNTLGRSERLKSERVIRELFDTGSNLTVYPFRLIYQRRTPSDNFSVKIGFSVPRKNFKRAVDRNRLKRRMREAYRLNKHFLIKKTAENFACPEIMLIYQGHKAENFNKICDSIKELLNKLSYKIQKLEC
jgi:ribonuclease P protein component